MARDSYSPLVRLKRIGVARRRKVGGTNFFFQKVKKKNKGTTKMLSKDRLLWMGSIAFIVKCTLIF